MSDPYMGGGDFMFQIAPIFIGIVFVLIIGVILVSVFQGIGQWHKNEQSPRLSVPAVVTSKRIDVKADHIYDFLYKVDRGKVELFDPSKHGQWEVKYDEFGKLNVGKVKEEEITNVISKSEGNVTNSFSFALESHLRDFLSKNLNSLAIGSRKLSLYIDNEGNDGVEFHTDVGKIDILAVDEEANYYVIELKVGKGSDVVSGQISRYMGWIKKKLADPNQKSVKGIIIANEIDDKLKYATSWIPDITIFKYSIRFDINETELD